MSTTPELEVPTPMGGVVQDLDFAPSIVFLLHYAALLPFIIWRFVKADRRTFLQLNTISFAIQRVVLYSLRASQAHGTDGRRAARGLLTYSQITFAQGYVDVLTDLLFLVRVLIVNATHGPDRIEPFSARPAVGDSDEAQEREKNNDQKTRKITRALFDPFNLAWLSALGLNIVHALKYHKAFEDQSTADLVFKMRYAGTAVPLFLTLIMFTWLAIMMRRLPDMNMVAARRLLAMMCLLMIPTIYRLAVMHNTVPFLLYTGPGSLTSLTPKLLFYFLYESPCWLAVALLLIPNTRQDFQTGLIGDWRSKDGQKSFKQKRREKEEKNEQQRQERETTAAAV